MEKIQNDKEVDHIVDQEFDPLCEDMDELDRQLQKLSASQENKDTENNSSESKSTNEIYTEQKQDRNIPDILEGVCSKFQLKDEYFKQLSEIIKFKPEEFAINEVQDSLISLKTKMEDKLTDVIRCISLEAIRKIAYTRDKTSLAQCLKLLKNAAVLRSLTSQQNKDIGNNSSESNASALRPLAPQENEDIGNKSPESNVNSVVIKNSIQDAKVNNELIEHSNENAKVNFEFIENNFQDESVNDELIENGNQDAKVNCEFIENNFQDENDNSIDVSDEIIPENDPDICLKEQTEKTDEAIISRMSSPVHIVNDDNSDDSVCFLEEVKTVQPEENLSPNIEDANGNTEEVTEELEIPTNYTQPSTSYMPSSGNVSRNKQPCRHTRSAHNEKKTRKYRNKYIPYEIKKECTTKKREHIRNSYKYDSYQWPLKSKDSGSDYKTRETDREYFNHARRCHHETKMKLLEKDSFITSERRKRNYHQDGYYGKVKRSRHVDDEEDDINRFRFEALLITAAKISPSAVLQLIIQEIETMKLETADDIKMWEKLGKKILAMVMDAKFKNIV